MIDNRQKAPTLFLTCKACENGWPQPRDHRVECKYRRRDGKDAAPIYRTKEGK